MRIAVLSYGSLRLPGVRMRVFDRAIPAHEIYPDEIVGYRRDQVLIMDGKPDDGIFPIIHPTDSDSVIDDCAVFYVSLRELQMIDEYEGPTYGRIVILTKRRRLVTVYVLREHAREVHERRLGLRVEARRTGS